MGREGSFMVEYVMTGFEAKFKGGGGGRTGDVDVAALLEGGGDGGLRASKTERSGAA